MNLNLSPRSLNEYISNEPIRKIIAISIAACKNCELNLGHTLITGQRGTGKTTLATLIAKELGLKYKIISATAIRKMSDLNVLFLSNLPSILIIDEIHNLEPAFTDAFHEVMDSLKYTYVEDGQLITVDVGPLNIIGITTDEGKLTAPMHSRFGKRYCLKPYTSLNLQKIIMNVGKNNHIDIDSSAAFELATRSNGIPRNAVLQFQNVFEFSLIYNSGIINRKIVLECLALHGIDTKGLNETQRDILRILSRSQKPVGQESLSQISGVGIEALTKLYEPPLLALGFIKRSSTGREITPAGRAHIKANVRKYGLCH